MLLAMSSQEEMGDLLMGRFPEIPRQENTTFIRAQLPDSLYETIGIHESSGDLN